MIRIERKKYTAPVETVSKPVKLSIDDIVSFVLNDYICEKKEEHHEDIASCDDGCKEEEAEADNESDDGEFSVLEPGYNCEVNPTGFNFIVKLKDFLENTKHDTVIMRYGVLQKQKIYKTNYNVSLFTSIFSNLLDTDFIIKTPIEQAAYVSQLHNLLYQEIGGDIFNTFGYKDFGWDRKTMMDEIYNFTMKNNIIRYICDYLSINIFVIDSDKMKTVYHGANPINIYRKPIFLHKIDENYEPIKFLQTGKEAKSLVPVEDFHNKFIDFLLENTTKNLTYSMVQKLSVETPEETDTSNQKYLKELNTQLEKKMKVDVSTKILESSILRRKKKAETPVHIESGGSESEE